jgi:hypothetical protein
VLMELVQFEGEDSLPPADEKLLQQLVPTSDGSERWLPSKNPIYPQIWKQTDCSDQPPANPCGLADFECKTLPEWLLVILLPVCFRIGRSRKQVR